MRRPLALLLIALVLSGINGCSAENTQQDPILGTWVINLKHNYTTFNSDGTYGKGENPEGALSPSTRLTGLEWGTWTHEEGVLTFTTSPESRYCKGIIGTYEVDIPDPGDQMLVTLIQDACDKRAVDFSSSLTRHTDS